MYDSILYVTGTPYFFHLMVTIIIAGIMVGAIIYDGESRYFWRGILSVLIYGVFILSVDSVRIYNVIVGSGIINSARAYAGIITISLVTLFYLLGIVIGVITVTLARKRAKKEVAEEHIKIQKRLSST